MIQTKDELAYRALLAEAERNRKARDGAKDATYARLVRRLRQLDDLPLPYEQAVRQLCEKLEY